MTESLRLPIYESLGANKSGRIDGLFLSPSELSMQIHQSMMKLKELDAMEQFPNTIFLLDRGAAPIDQILKYLLPHYTSGQNPTVNHINIGRNTIGKNGLNVPFNGDPEIIRNTYELIPNRLNRILIIDDYVRSGDTIQKAISSIRLAFPESKLSSLVFFNKIPRWQGLSEYTGLEEYTNDDYSDLALEKLNTEIAKEGIHFRSFEKFINSINNNNRKLSYRYYEIKRNLMGTIPFAKLATSLTFPMDEVEKEIKYLCEKILENTNSQL